MASSAKTSLSSPHEEWHAGSRLASENLLPILSLPVEPIMKFHTSLCFATLLTMGAAALSACGAGGAGSNLSTSVAAPAPTETPTPAPTSTPTPTPTPSPVTTSAQNGKIIYIASCAMCHGSRPAQNSGRVLLGASAPALITSAIDQNVGGMGFLKNTISAQNANDLAAYLATPNI
jgi:mono/diheme cytochrome c family protein